MSAKEAKQLEGPGKCPQHDDHEGHCCPQREEGPCSESEGDEEEVELDLDESGRIAYGGSLKEGQRSFPDAFIFSPELLEKLRADCQLAFTARAQEQDGDYSQGDTFFLMANETPTTAIELIAKRIFELHTKDATFDASKSGAEWWAQYIEEEDDIGLHFDKDYSLEEDGINLFPHIGTVTYLSDEGGPTMVLNRRGTFIHGQDVSGPIESCFLSLPQVGKHFCFDGRLLHGAPSELRTLWGDGKGSTQPLSSRPLRVTLLVNIWCNHKPATAEPPSPQMRAKMTPASEASELVLSSAQETCPIPTVAVPGLPTPDTTWRFSGEGSLKYDVAIAVPAPGSISLDKPTVELRFEEEGGGCITRRAGRKRKRKEGAGEEGEDGEEEEEDGEDECDSEVSFDGGSSEEEEEEEGQEEEGEEEGESGSEEEEGAAEGLSDDGEEEEDVVLLGGMEEVDEDEDEEAYYYVHAPDDDGEGEEEEDDDDEAAGQEYEQDCE